eukprot:13176029-Alexandrium_andersonii.AAC.1
MAMMVAMVAIMLVKENTMMGHTHCAQAPTRTRMCNVHACVATDVACRSSGAREQRWEGGIRLATVNCMWCRNLYVFRGHGQEHSMRY